MSLQVSAHRSSPPLYRNSAFLLLWAAYAISAMGDHISEMAVLKFMGAMDSPDITRLGAMITFMFMLPFFVLGPVNGLLADRLPRRGIMIFADTVRVVIMLNFGFLLATFAPIGTVGAFVPLMLVGVFAAMFSPARSALLPTLVGEGQLVRANAMISGLGVIATMIAVLIGGYLAKHYAPQVAFRIDACTFAASALCLLFLRPPACENKRHYSGTGLADLAEAFRYVRQHRRVAQLIILAVLFWSCGAVVRSTIPALVRDVYDRHDYLQIGVFQFYLGLGLLIGSVILTILGDAVRSDAAITWSLAGMAGAIVVLGVSVFAPISSGLAHDIGVVAVISAGAFSAAMMASYNALLQRIVPNRLRGRIFGLTDLVTMAGLLLATGLLGIPKWTNIDRWIGWILIGAGLVMLLAAAVSLIVRLRRGRFAPVLRFWWNLNEFYCKWWFRMQREGICTVPAEGPVILVSNHTSAIDPLLLAVGIPYRMPGFLIAKEYADLPLVGRITRIAECVPIKRDGHDAAGTKAAFRHLKAGKVLGIFIEGGIPRPGEKRRPKDGAAMLALKANAVVIPVHISGTLWSENILWGFFRRHNARVRFGQPIDLTPYRGHKADKQTISQISQLFFDRIAELGQVGL